MGITIRFLKPIVIKYSLIAIKRIIEINGLIRINSIITVNNIIVINFWTLIIKICIRKENQEGYYNLILK